MPAPIRPEVVAQFDRMLAAGETIRHSAKTCGVSEAWAYDRSKGRRKRDQAKFYSNLEAKQPDPKDRRKLKPEAAHALECFPCFRLRYFGRKSLPWEGMAANKVIAALESDRKEYQVINAPPGGGKTTLFTCDIPCWAIVRDRSNRVLIGGAIQTNATNNSNRIRKMLQATVPYQASDDEKAKGMVDATGCLATDFGRFKPDNANPDLWRRDAFAVAQLGGGGGADKEPTVQAYGRRGGVLGNRVRLCVWDDLVDSENMRTVEAREDMKRWWKEIAETRIDPGGVIILQGQRLSADDLYRFVLDMRTVVLDDDGEEVVTEEPPAKYEHIVFKAHYDDTCTGKHPKGMEPWPASCLLDPFKLPWRELLTKKRDDPDSFAALYQQEDAEASGVLAKKLWISGGQDPETREVFPGCWDGNRRTWELPDLPGEVLVYATVDPSPTRWWGLQVWAYHPASERYFLLDLVRRRMQMADFLDYDPDSRELTGLAVAWQELSQRMGHPISTWVVEKNAAQRFFFTYKATERFLQRYGVHLIAHETTNNKHDKEYGIGSMGPLYRSGRIRLPGYQGDDSRLASLKLVDEVTKWPNGSTDDQVMSSWFGYLNIQNVVVANRPSIRTRSSWSGAPRLVAVA